MPSLATHHVFSDMVLKKLDNKVKNKFISALDIYHAFAQSHDYLYYSFNKKIKRLGYLGHHRNTQAYLLNIVQGIIDNKLEDKPECIAYLYGSITHYILDAICHPFIFYKTGVYYKNKPERHKYRNEHTHIEKHLDAFYYTNFYKKPYYNVNVNKELIKNPIFTKDLENLVSEAYLKTYNYPNIGKIFPRCIKNAKFIIGTFINDRTGTKQKIALFINKFTKSHPEYYTTFIKEPIIDYLNTERKTWNHPCDKNETYNYSFNDLVKQSEERTVNIINKLHECIYKTKDIESLKDVILELDYATGYDTKDDRVMKYFEY